MILNVALFHTVLAQCNVSFTFCKINTEVQKLFMNHPLPFKVLFWSDS